MKLWQKDKVSLKEVEKFTVGNDRDLDIYLAPFDVLGSLAHTQMLESIGFMYTHEVDPFDGGPHYRTLLKNISLIKNKISGSLSFDGFNSKLAQDYLVQIPTKEHDFLAIRVKTHLGEKGEIILDPSIRDEMNIPVGDKTTAIPFY